MDACDILPFCVLECVVTSAQFLSRWSLMSPVTGLEHIGLSSYVEDVRRRDHNGIHVPDDCRKTRSEMKLRLSA